MRAAEPLAQRQRRLLAAVKGRGGDAGGFTAPELALLRETLLWWRRLGITQACRLTAALLTAQARFEAAVEAFVRDTAGADSIEAQRDLFLAHVARDRDPLCAAVAATELALLARLRDPEMTERRIAWPCDPGPVLDALLGGQPLPPPPHHPFTVIIGRSGLDWFSLPA